MAQFFLSRKYFLCWFLSVGIVQAAVFAQTPRPVPAAYNSLVPRSYVRTLDALKPGVDPNTMSSEPTQNVQQKTGFVDGLGRPLQSVIKEGGLETSTSVKFDLVTAVEYDSYGRELYSYLPFAATSTDGGFKLDPFQQQQAFMTAEYGGQSEAFFYGETVFEASPLGRVRKKLAPGNSWAGAGRGVETKYWLNTASDDVKKFTVTDDSSPFGTYTKSGEYAEGELQKTVTADENGKQVIEFKDRNGLVVLKKVQVNGSGDTNAGTSYPDWLSTYYLYDAFGQLRAVIQPEGVKALSQSSWVFSQVVLDEQSFRYAYDSRNRMIRKKVPGAGETWMVYDARDRLVMTQDAKLRESDQKKWLYTSYDALNRPQASGFIYDPTNFNNLSFHLNAAFNSTNYPQLSSYPGFEELTNTFYDGYSWLSSYGTPLSSSLDGSFNSYFLPASTSVWPYAEPVSQSGIVNGMVTGSRVKVLNSSPVVYLYTVNIYDVQGRVIQVLQKNISGGTDVLTTQYSWSGQPLMTVQKQEKSGTNPQTTVVLSKMSYDDLWRLVSVEKKVSTTLVNNGSMPAAWTKTVTHQYNKSGQLKLKSIAPDFAGGAGMEKLTNEYNIRGWLLGTNRNYIANTGSSRFGFELAYDKPNSALGNTGSLAFEIPQYNGNISGTIWRSMGDGKQRKYDFTYDPTNRLTGADFKQYSGSGFDKAANVDFSVSYLSYDDNGNILSMAQKGLKVNSSPFIDRMAYTFVPGTNRLRKVMDSVTVNHKMGDFFDGTNGASDDYDYDVNGNLSYDLNKAISGIQYNHLNLPTVISVTGKGSISYTYDAAGSKLRKVSVDNTSPGKVITTTTSYFGSLVFESRQTVPSDPGDYTDKLQFAAHEEGRIRWVAAAGSNPAKLVYDFFLKDHLGNVRMVLTEEQQTDSYPAATMESATAGTEEAFYTNLSTTRVDCPSGFPSATGQAKVARVTAAAMGSKVGPAILLKVMSGDKFNVMVHSWWNSAASPGSAVSPLNDLVMALASGIAPLSGGKAVATDLLSPGVLSPNVSEFLSTQPIGGGSPKAYLNWILLDEQFKYVSQGSGFDQVGGSNQLKTHSFTNMPISQNGYLYIYVSNETDNIDVFFDNLQVTHTRGPLLEETHYYPFGLTMQGISSKAAGKSENRLRFNDGTELESKEFSEGSGIELYSTTFRSYDPQIGRFHQVDPLAELTFGVGTYVFGLNNPISFNDPLGLTSDTITLPEIVINGGPAPPPKCFHCGISPVVNPESQNNNPPETSDDSDPNRSTFGDIAYEINRFNPLANLINGLHTWAFGYDTYGVPQDRYQGTAQIISAIPLGRIASATTNLVQGATSRVVITTITQLQKKFNHAQAFGVSGNWSVENGLKFLSQINQHLNHSATTVIAGTYRNSSKNVLFYLNPFDGKLVITSLDGEFITAYKATQDQVQSIVERQFLW